MLVDGEWASSSPHGNGTVEEHGASAQCKARARAEHAGTARYHHAGQEEAG